MRRTGSHTNELLAHCYTSHSLGGAFKIASFQGDQRQRGARKPGYAARPPLRLLSQIKLRGTESERMAPCTAHYRPNRGGRGSEQFSTLERSIQNVGAAMTTASYLRLAELTDGTSNVFLFGEK